MGLRDRTVLSPFVDATVALIDGDNDGSLLGAHDGSTDGTTDGSLLGTDDGNSDG